MPGFFVRAVCCARNPLALRNRVASLLHAGTLSPRQRKSFGRAETIGKACRALAGAKRPLHAMPADITQDGGAAVALRYQAFVERAHRWGS
jgi:hypothetical protein